MTKCGRVTTEIKPNDPNRVKTDINPGKFCKVLKIITRCSTSMTMTFDDRQSQSEHSILQYYWDWFLLYCSGKRIKLSLTYHYSKSKIV